MFEPRIDLFTFILCILLTAGLTLIGTWVL